jgi:hypothetical protein
MPNVTVPSQSAATVFPVIDVSVVLLSSVTARMGANVSMAYAVAGAPKPVFASFKQLLARFQQLLSRSPCADWRDDLGMSVTTDIGRPCGSQLYQTGSLEVADAHGHDSKLTAVLLSSLTTPLGTLALSLARQAIVHRIRGAGPLRLPLSDFALKTGALGA